MRYFFLLTIFAAANSLFFLVPWAHIHGVFNSSDIGLALIFAGLLYIIVKNPDGKPLRTPFTWLVFVYLLFVTIQASVAAMNYGQSILSGLIGVRHQFYYLSFFLFLYLLDDTDKIERFLKLVTMLAVVLILLSLFNYFVHIIFYSRAAKDWGIRAGIRRPLIPAMDLVTLAFFWVSSSWLEGGRRRRSNWFLTVFFLAAHIFRQTRGRNLPVLVLLVWNMVARRRYKYLAAFGLLGLATVAVAQVVSTQNVVLWQFQSIANHASQNAWDGREAQLEADWKVFSEHPWFGSGAVALRATSAAVENNPNLALVARRADLGYTHFLKAYGIAGMVWLAFFFYQLGMTARRVDRQYRTSSLANTALTIKTYVYFVMVSFITLNQLMFSYRILLVCFCAAALVRLRLQKPVAEHRRIVDDSSAVGSSSRILAPARQSSSLLVPSQTRLLK